MIKIYFMAIVFIFPVAIRCNNFTKTSGSLQNSEKAVEIKLPNPVYKSNTSIEEALLKRRSVRRYNNEWLELKDISQLLWAAQGITSVETGGRTAPSAGALYPLEIYIACSKVNTVLPGVYHYRPDANTIKLITDGDKHGSLTMAAHLQPSINRSAAVIVITAVYRRTTKKYSEKGTRYVNMEAGHAAQNICLQAVSLNIGAVTMGSFKDSTIKQILNLPKEQEPLYLIPIGKINK